MRLDFTNIGCGILLACMGVHGVFDGITENKRRQDCDARGGWLAKVDDAWFAEKKCVVKAPAP